MNICRRRNWLRPGRASLGLLAVALLGFLVVQACDSAAHDITPERTPGPPAPTKLLPAPEVSRLAPDFTLVDLEGNLVTLSDFRGKAVFVNFWATWCPACRAEMPDIEAVYQEYKDKGVVVIGVDILESEDVVRQFVEQGGYNWVFVIDTIGEVAADYNITAIPTSFFIDGEGVIQAVSIGAMTKRQMEAKLAEAMR